MVWQHSSIVHQDILICDLLSLDMVTLLKVKDQLQFKCTSQLIYISPPHLLGRNLNWMLLCLMTTPSPMLNLFQSCLLGRRNPVLLFFWTGTCYSCVWCPLVSTLHTGSFHAWWKLWPNPAPTKVEVLMFLDNWFIQTKSASHCL